MFPLKRLLVLHFFGIFLTWKLFQKILSAKDYLSENAPGSFYDKFYSSKLPPNTTRSSSSNCHQQLNVKNFNLRLKDMAVHQLHTK